MRLFIFFVITAVIISSCSTTSVANRKLQYNKWQVNLINEFNQDTAFSRYIAALMKVKKGDTICDVGSGFGINSALLALYLPGVIFFEEDINKKLCNKLRFQKTFDLLNPSADIENFKFFIGTATRLPFPKKSFGCVTVFRSIHEFTNRELMMKEIRRILRPQGLLYIRESVYTNTSASDSVCKFPYLSEKELTSLLVKNGFEVLSDIKPRNEEPGQNVVIRFLECRKVATLQDELPEDDDPIR